MWSFKLAETRGLLCLFLVVTFLGMNNAFSKKFYKAISEENTKCKLTNIISSPLSLEIVLAVLGLGARGNTKSQISNVIGVPLEISSLRSRYSPILFGIKENKGIILRIASQIFVDKSFPLREDFVKNSVNTFAVGTQALDFANQPHLAGRAINTWVYNQTEGLITKLFEPGDIRYNTKVVVTNAIYFKGKWATPFDSKFTKPRKFQLAEGNKVDVVMMHGKISARFGYPYGLNALVLELPYELGLTYMFSDWADFSGMSNSRQRLKVSKVLQKAFIEVSEEGTKAAAATGVEITPVSSPPSFVVNRPFVFILWHKRSGRKVFVGRFAGPE